MKRLARLCLVAVAALVVGGSAAASGWDQAPEYVSSEPDDGATVHESPAEVVIRFSEPLDAESSLVVRDECGKRIDDGNVEIFVTEMRVGIATERSGKHTAGYDAVGIASLTGSTEGSISYTVHMGPSCKKGTSGHGSHDGDGNGGGEHEGHDGEDPEHEADHTTGSTHEGDHATGSGKGRGKGHGKHGNHGKSGDPEPTVENQDPGDQGPTVAIGDTPPGGAAGGAAVLAALAASAVLGAMGGWLLRETAPRS